jgi:hypothetical protein
MFPVFVPAKEMAVADEESAILRASVASISVPEVRLPKATVRTSVFGTTPMALSFVELFTIHKGGIHCIALAAALKARIPVDGTVVKSGVSGPSLGLVLRVLEPSAVVAL